MGNAFDLLRQRGESWWALPGRVRLRTLILLRWMAVAGQSAAVLVVHFALGFNLPLGAALGVIAASAWVNLVLMITLPSQRLVREWEAAAQLGYDLLQLALLIGLTGGVDNPFMLLFIAPVAVAATVLRPSVTAGLAGLAFVCVGALAVWGAPLPWVDGQRLDLPGPYRAGLSAAVLVGLGFTGVYAWRVAAEQERLGAALAAVQAVLSREQKFSALGGLAAAAAHELGTPLATIHLVAKEMARSLPPGSPLTEDVQLLISQSERCRDILRQLAQRPEAADAVHARLSLSALLGEAAQAHRGLGVEVALSATPMRGGPGASEPELRRMPEIIHGIANLVENAVGFAASTVEVAARWSGTEIEIAVRDDGPGFPASVLSRLGEPYVSERGAAVGGGLGLGFFIAKTLLERTGARVEFFNRAAPRTGAVVRATWRRADIEAPALSAPG